MRYPIQYSKSVLQISLIAYYYQTEYSREGPVPKLSILEKDQVQIEYSRKDQFPN